MAYENQKIKARQVIVTNQQTETLGIATNVPMGVWQANMEYKKLNMVRSHNATYQAKKNNQGVEPTITQGWQEVWQVVAYDGLVTPIGDYPNMSVGKATQAENDGSGGNIAEQFADINKKIPSTASAENQLADKAFVNSSVNNSAAFYITYTQGSETQFGQAFPTAASLLNATTFYSGKDVRVPTQNDYATVLADETRPKGVDGSYPTTRYSYQGGTHPNGQWSFQYVVNNTSLTQAQVDAINSGITKELVETIGNGNVLSVNGKTGAVTITPESIDAVNKAGDEMTGTLTMTGQGYPKIIFKSVAAAANGSTVFLEQQLYGQLLIIGRTVDDTANNRYVIYVPESTGTMALIDNSGNFTAPIVQADSAFLLGAYTGSDSQGRIENNATSKSLDILAPNPSSGAYGVCAKNRGGAYAVFRAKEVYEGTNRVYSPNNPNTQLIYDSNTSITISAGGEKTIYVGSPLKTGDMVQIVGYLGNTSSTPNIVNILFPINLSKSLQYTGVAYKTLGGYTGRFEVYLVAQNASTYSLDVRYVREYQPDNTGNNIQMTVQGVHIRRFAK